MAVGAGAALLALTFAAFLPRRRTLPGSPTSPTSAHATTGARAAG
jgi:hypothetical protein